MEHYDDKFLEIEYSLFWLENENGNHGSGEVVTVLSPTFNHRDFLEDYFRGINQQITVYNVEVLIIDDASNKDSFEKLTQLASLCKFPVKIIKLHRNHHGQSSKFLLASRFVKGDFVAFCDPSDYWTNPNKLEMQLNEIKSTGSSWSVTRAKKQDLKSSETSIMLENLNKNYDKKYISWGLLNLAWGDVPFCTMVIQRSVYQRVMRYLETNPPAPAMDHIYMMAAVAEGDCAFIDQTTANYRLGAKNSFTENYIFDELKRSKLFESHCKSLSQFLAYLGVNDIYPPTVKYISWLVGQYSLILYKREVKSAANTVIETNLIEFHANHCLVFGSGFYGKIFATNDIFSKNNVTIFESGDLHNSALFKKCVSIQNKGKKIAIYISIFDPHSDLMATVRSYLSNLDDIRIYNFPEQLLLQLTQLDALSFINEIAPHIPLHPDIQIPTTSSLI